MTNKFRKSFSGYTPEQMQTIFVHSQAVWTVINKISKCITPRPLTFDAAGIAYEFLELPPSMPMLLQEEIGIENSLVQAGAVLAALHNSSDTQGLMHGDFVPHNMFTDGDNLFLIDAHPPELLGFRKDILYGDGVRDILCFVISIPSCLGFKKAVKRKEYIHNCYRAFIRGYLTKKSAIPLRSPRVYCSLARDIFINRYRAGFGIKSAILHVVASMYWLWEFRKLARGY